MLFHQENHLLPEGGGGFQPVEDLIGQLSADLGVSVEMAGAGFVQGEGGGLSDVVEQSGPPQGQFPGNAFHHLSDVSVDVFGMVGIVLFKAKGIL